jgi:hypothetical protein
MLGDGAEGKLFLLNPKLIHANKCPRIFRLESMPKLEIGRRLDPRKALTELNKNPALNIKPQKLEMALPQNYQS